MSTREEIVDLVSEVVYEKLNSFLFRDLDHKTQDKYRDIMYEVYDIIEEAIGSIPEIELEADLIDEEYLDDEDFFDDEDFE